MRKPFEMDPHVLIAAAETEDEIGAVLRAHLCTEQFLNWFIRVRTEGEMSTFVKEPRDFRAKLSLAVALALPLPFAGAIHQINVIRNGLAHRLDALDSSQVEEFARQVNKLSPLAPDFAPLSSRYITLEQKRPGVKIAFGSEGPRIDFIIASFALLATATVWSHSLLAYMDSPEWHRMTTARYTPPAT
ncbi:hypothetical protein FHT39_003774 [Mitsuaria sp. BK045]|uniref:hypothetical protein n=1 Tax=unclassified Roseateles TaxID=2626991 RepID=UPI001620CF9D|nr:MULTISPECIES: hypothetical protein [unclassified Roseateles]MBB3295094.1 hypothetical protein [Mitsuaria sp. BK041]MBB3364310.1 hypothetical protein [Mitsuaria sp. BK045]